MTVYPNLFKCSDGTQITDVKGWEVKRRPELLQLFRKYEYGNLPDMSDVEIQIRLADSRIDKNTMDSQAIRRTIEITAIRKGIHFSFPAVIFIPDNAKEPVPCFLTVCNRGIQNADPARHFLSDFWPAETIVARGYAAAEILTQDIAPDYDEGFTMGFHKLFPEYTGFRRPDDAWGAISAWSWGASKVMDYLEKDPLINSKKVAIVGHSRGGKTALWTVAQDIRFAMAVSSCAGNSGDALARKSKGETIADITGRFPYWFCRNYQQFAHNEEKLPFDQHELIALIAPRFVYTTSKTFDAWAFPEGQFKSLLLASEVWKMYGKQGFVDNTKPKPEHPISCDSIGYHIKTGIHDMNEYDWDLFLDFADARLK